MRALLAAVGTRGDVQPALALALELRKLGHAVRLCISPNFVDWAKSLGLEAVPMGVEMRMPGRTSGTMPTLTPEELRRLRESMPDLITDQFETIGAAADGCDVIVGANAHQYAAPSIAEHAGIGCVTAVYAPVALPSPDLAPPPVPGQAIDPARTSHRGAVAQRRPKPGTSARSSAINHNRRRLGMDPIDDVLDYVLTDHTWLAADAALAPVPATPGRRSSRRARGCSPIARPFLRISKHSSKVGSRPSLPASAACPPQRDVDSSADRRRPCCGPQDHRLERLGRSRAHRRCGRLHGRRRCEPRRSLSAGRGSRPSRRRRHHRGCSPRWRSPGHHTDVRRPVLLGQPNRGSRGRGDDPTRHDDGGIADWRTSGGIRFGGGGSGAQARHDRSAGTGRRLQRGGSKPSTGRGSEDNQHELPLRHLRFPVASGSVEGSASGASGNYGLLDRIAALQ